MDARSALTARIGSLRWRLYQVNQTIQAPALDAHLRGRVGPRFDKLLSQQLATVKKLEQQVSNGQPLAACWHSYDDLDRECNALFEECLGFVQGALARKSGVDGGLCRLADDLLDDLAAWSDVGWRRFTLLATAEFYREIAGLIRISFPVVSLWDLPIVAHEFGHYLGPELQESAGGKRVYPFQVMLEAADEERPAYWPLPHTKAWYHLNEHFADLFATYSLGPAFACSFILSRLNPIHAHSEQATHPTHAKRVHSVFWMLEEMNRLGGFQKPYRGLIDALQSLWEESLKESGQEISLPDAEVSRQEGRLAELHDLLERTTPPQLAYQIGDWQRSQVIDDALRAPHWEPAGVDLGEGSRRDVLNAAWLGRLRLDGGSDWEAMDVAKRARKLYQLVPPREF